MDIIGSISRIFTGGPSRLEQKIDRLEYFSHGARGTYVGNNRVLVKAVLGGHVIAYLVEADDLLISPWFIINGQYETALTDFFLNRIKPDSHCLDVGSNFGFFACLFARLAPKGRIMAIEADRTIYKLCRDNLAINGFSEIGKAIHGAACDSNDEIVLHRRVGRSGNTSIFDAPVDFTEHMGEPPAEAFSVKGVRIDDLLDRFDGRLDFIKIDVEGAEPLAMRGAQRTIESNPQLNIVMEWSPGQIRIAGFDVRDFLQEILDKGLSFHDFVRGKPRPMTTDELLNTEYLSGILIKR
jgi:FkbM family methyltransferase